MESSMEYDINVIINLLGETIGLEKAKALIEESIERAQLEKKEIYNINEIQKICDYLKTQGGIVSLFAKILNLPEYREVYLRRYAEKEKIEREKIEELYRKLSEAHEKLKKMQEEIVKSEKFSAIGRMASVIGHELKNPLATIKNIAYYFKKYLPADSNEKIKSFVDILNIEVDRATDIINSLLDFARIKKLNVQKVNLVEIAELTISLLHLPTDKQIEIKKDYSHKEIIVEVDSDKIRQVLINLFQNSIEAIHQKKGIITLQIIDEGQNVLIILEDTGCGINEDIKPKIFEPLFTTKPRGLGFGLAIVKEILNQHNATIDIESEVDKGTKVKIVLPKIYPK